VITIDVWAKGYADATGLTRVAMPINSTDEDIQRAVRQVGSFARLAGVNRPRVQTLSDAQLIAYQAAFKGDNS